MHVVECGWHPLHFRRRYWIGIRFRGTRWSHGLCAKCERRLREENYLTPMARRAWGCEILVAWGQRVLTAYMNGLVRPPVPQAWVEWLKVVN